MIWLNKEKRKNKIKGIIFDLDGVLVKSHLDFRLISREIFGSQEKKPILEGINNIKSQEKRARAWKILEKHEKKAALNCTLTSGITELFKFLEQRGIKRSIVTRNSKKSICIILNRFKLSFNGIVSREDAPPKPAKEPVLLACRKMEISPKETIFLGDYEFDMISGRKAGVITALLRSNNQSFSENADVVVDSISEFTKLVRNYLATDLP